MQFVPIPRRISSKALHPFCNKMQALMRKQCFHTRAHAFACVCSHVQVLISSCMLWTRLKLIRLVNRLGKGRCFYSCFLTWAGRGGKGRVGMWMVQSSRREMRWEGKKRKAEEFARFVQVHPPINKGQMRSDREITLSRPPPFCKRSSIISGGRNSSWQIFGAGHSAVMGLGRGRRGGWLGGGRACREEREASKAEVNGEVLVAAHVLRSPVAGTAKAAAQFGCTQRRSTS